VAAPVSQPKSSDLRLAYSFRDRTLRWVKIMDSMPSDYDPSRTADNSRDPYDPDWKDRNVWDPETPRGSTSLYVSQAKVLDICIYSFPRSLKNELDIQADVAEANSIWCQGGINIQAVQWARLEPDVINFPSNKFIDLFVPDLARRVDCAAFPVKFFELPLWPDCPEDAPTVIVYYIPPDTFANGATGCHHFLPTPPYAPLDRDGHVRDWNFHNVLLTDQANGRALAHELAHALMTRLLPPGTKPGIWINDDPDAGQDPNDSIHDANPNNILSHGPNATQISEAQAIQANKSKLLDRRDLAYGFKSPVGDEVFRNVCAPAFP
jgi:hypothetical protein